jgi:hypothetical protein
MADSRWSVGKDGYLDMNSRISKIIALATREKVASAGIPPRRVQDTGAGKK